MLRLAVPLLALLVIAPGASATIPPQRDPFPELSIGDVTTNETLISAGPTVTLSAPSSETVTVHYATADGTADWTDYIAQAGTLTFPPGTTTARVPMDIKGDALDEPDETFFVNLSDAQNATIARGRATITIVDDDPVPFRLLDAYVDARWSVHRSFTRVTRFAIHRPSGTIVAVRCRGKACPLRVGRKLLPGTVVDVRIEALYKPLIGRVYQYRIRARKAPTFKALCLPPGKLSPEPC
jgi:Calx-beta domain